MLEISGVAEHVLIPNQWVDVHSVVASSNHLFMLMAMMEL